ncbi:hypothetical protein [Bacillus alkalicellulosilyticus]|uniref:hypothetical protein n=1 Tax=Alkalihalobacterium alkalicellulosilyticum TaxID=1912214 RepID=UPI000997A8F7|nr:hypothetical protein [Bacillus alkalicellulosilyticus]
MNNEKLIDLTIERFSTSDIYTRNREIIFLQNVQKDSIGPGNLNHLGVLLMSLQNYGYEGTATTRILYPSVYSFLDEVKSKYEKSNRTLLYSFIQILKQYITEYEQTKVIQKVG